MERKTAGEFDQELLNLFDLYVHGDIDRRGFLERAAKFAVGGMTAAMLLDALRPRFAQAQQVAKDDKRLRIEWIDYESPQGTGKVRAYLVRPEAVTAKLPGVLVVHEGGARVHGGVAERGRGRGAGTDARGWPFACLVDDGRDDQPERQPFTGA